MGFLFEMRTTKESLLHLLEPAKTRYEVAKKGKRGTIRDLVRYQHPTADLCFFSLGRESRVLGGFLVLFNTRRVLGVKRLTWTSEKCGSDELVPTQGAGISTNHYTSVFSNTQQT